MKRAIALLLAALLLLTAASAVAEDNTLAYKFYQQAVKESAYRGTITLSVSGAGSAAVDASLWAVLKSLAPRLSLSIEHATTPYKDEGQATLTLTMDGNTSAKFTYLYDETLQAFSGTFLGGDSAYYSAARSWSLTELLAGFLREDQTWPPVWQMILDIENAPEEWKTRAASRIDVYKTKVGLWMNGYAKYSAGRDGDKAYSQLSCVIPAQAVKAEIKQLMVDFYNDSELLTLLREIVSAREAAAYLQPSMMNALFSMVDSLQMNGDVEVVKRYDAYGAAMLDRVSLPFGSGGKVSVLTVSCAYQEAGQNWTVAGALNDGTEFEVSCLLSEETIYTGSVRLVLPEDEEASFVVSDSAARKTIAFDYNLNWEPGEDVYTLATDRFSRDIRGSLLIKPKEGDLPEQSVTLEMNMSSGSSKRSATQLNGTLTWRDMESGASISVILTSRTAAPFAYVTPSALTGAMRVDLLSADTLAALVRTWVQRTESSFASLASGSLGSVIPIATVQPK